MKRISAAVLLALALVFVISPVTSRAEEREGYWEFREVIHETEHFNEELVDKDYWSDNMSGSAGTGKFTSTYVGPDEDDDYAPRPKNGESATVAGSVSAPPKYIDGGKNVKLNIDLSVTSTKQHFWDFSGDAYARFDDIDVPMGHITYGAIDFTAKDSDGENLKLSVWLYAPTNWRAKEYGNNPKLNVAVFAQAPYGSKEGDETSIYTQISMGNMCSRTEYIYRWHAKGKAPVEKTSSDGKGSPLTWLLPGTILIGGGVYIVNRAKRKKKNKSDDRTRNAEVIKQKRDKLKKIAKKGNKYADKLSDEYNEMLKSVEWNDGKLGFDKEKKFDRLNELYKKFMRGEVGWEEETLDEMGRLENETSFERLQRNRESWKETTKQGTLDTIEEASKGDTAKAVILRVGVGALTGGHSDGVFAATESYYTMKEAVEEGKSVTEAATKAYTNLAIDFGTSKVMDAKTRGSIDDLLVDRNNEMAMRVAENLFSETSSNVVKGIVDN